MTVPRKIIIDTDPGVGIPGTDADDPIAILLALADDRLELLGVTTIFGNCPPDIGARGARLVLDTAGFAGVPVSVGSATPLSGNLPDLLAEAYQGSRGREGNIALPSLEQSAAGSDAADFIIEQVHAHPGQVTLVPIGPMTNIATAIGRDPSIVREIGSIVFMGGALGRDPEFGRGNITSVAECNIWYDAVAADIVLRSGIDLTMVGLDVTNPNKHVMLSVDAIRSLDSTSGGVEGLLAAICATYLEAPMFDWGHGCVLYDPLAVAVAADQSIGTFEELHVGVETTGTLTSGQTVELPGAANLRAMIDTDGRRVVNDMLTRILSLSPTKEHP